jgi:hypothetical protein
MKMFVHNNTLRNLKRGIVERVLYLVKDGRLVPCHRPTLETVRRHMDGFRKQLRKKLPPTTPISMDEFPELYWGRKRLIYQRAVESLKLHSIDVRDSYLKWFVKIEKLDATTKDDPAPRIISPRNPRFNVMAGIHLKQSEHLLFRGINRVWGDRTVAKGLNSAQTASLIKRKWDSFTKPVAVGLDASRFDQHVSDTMLEGFEHQVYKDWFKSPEFDRLMAWQRFNRGFGDTPDGYVQAEVQGCRMSGDMNTSMGNCLIMCGMVWSYCQANNIVAKLLNNGDDCVVFMEQKDLPKFNAHLDRFFQKLGFDMKVEEPAYEMEKIEFCQTRPIRVGVDEWIMCRTIERALSRDAMALINVDHPESLAAWCASVGSAGTAAFGGVPILDAFYEYMTRQGNETPKWEKSYGSMGGLKWASKGMNRRRAPILDITRYSFYIAFGILPGEQQACEAYFNGLAPIVKTIPPRPDDKPSPRLSLALSNIVSNLDTLSW